MMRLAILLLLLLPTIAAAQTPQPASRLRRLNSEPATCTAGNVYFNLATDQGRICGPNNTWADIGGAGGGVTASSVDTFTNKTLDTEATGNVFTSTHKTWFQGAGCNSSVASSLLDLPATLAPTPTCQTGTNTQTATLDFPDTDGMFSAQVVTALPSDFTGTVDAKIKWKAAAITGDVIWNVATICVADAETDDPAFNVASTVTDTAKGTTLQMNDATITGVTITGCAAGELMHIKVSRDRTTTGDTIAGVVSFYGIEITSRRQQ